VLYLLFWGYLAIDPLFPQDWLLENILVFVAVPAAVILDKKYGFSLEGSLYLFIFMSLHAVGSHYTYSHMPLFDMAKDVIGLNRNHYDRIVHLLFGYLIFIPLLEIFLKCGIKKSISLALTFFIMFSSSSFYEIVEWIAAEIANPQLGLVFVGIQGDVWDSQKDTAMAMCGNIIGLIRGVYVKNR